MIKCRQREDGQLKISTLNLVDMAIQITLGIIYLHSQCICYKDLATRNCLYVFIRSLLLFPFSSSKNNNKKKDLLKTIISSLNNIIKSLNKDKGNTQSFNLTEGLN